MIKILNLKLVKLLEYQNIKTFLQKAMLQIGLKKFLWLKKFKKLCRGCVINDHKGEGIVKTFYEKELQKINQEKFKVEKVIKRKGDKV